MDRKEAIRIHLASIDRMIHFYQQEQRRIESKIKDLLQEEQDFEQELLELENEDFADATD